MNLLQHSIIDEWEQPPVIIPGTMVWGEQLTATQFKNLKEMNVHDGCHAIMWNYTFSQYHWGPENYSVSSVDLH